MNLLHGHAGGIPALAGPSWTVEEIARLAGGHLDRPESASAIFTYERLSLDTRTLRPGDLFVALRGENHDGHVFLPEAVGRGAAGALVDHPLDAPFAQVITEDSLKGWQRWAGEHRAQCPDLPVLALTGSSGKTTAKDLLSHLLAGEGPVWATQGNRNNHIGVPWTLLGLDPAHSFAVVEMGMNHAGEIRLLSRLAAPTAALITSVGTAHVGLLGSREAILAAKLEIVEGLPRDASLVLPHDPWILERLPADIRRHRVRTFGTAPPADWHLAGPVEWSLEGTRFATPVTGSVQMPLLGHGAVLSCLAAFAAAEALGVDPVRLVPRLATAPRRAMRMEPRRTGERGEMLWIADCYNASPESARLAIEFLREVPHRGRRILVLGELGELGVHSEAIHQDLGRRAGAIETVLFVGHEAQAALKANRESAVASSSNDWVPDAEAAADWLRPRLRPGDLVLLKGSRRIALERILERFDRAHREEG